MRLLPRSLDDVVTSLFLLSVGCSGTAWAQAPLLAGEALPGPIGRGVHKTQAADVDGDGLQDLVIWVMGRSLVQVAYGQSDGTLQLPEDLLETDFQIFSLDLGDLNGDGILDIVTVTQPFAGISPYLSSQGTWSAGPLSPWPFQPSAIGTEFRLADVDSDGQLDLYARGNVGPTFRPEVARGLGGGLFDSVTPAVNGPWAASVYDFADVDMDGDLDLVAANYAGAAGFHPAAVIYGNGSLPLDPSQTVPVGAPDPTPRFVDLAIGDEEGDGDRDLFVLAAQSVPFGLSGRDVLVGLQGPGSTFGAVTVRASTAEALSRIYAVDAEGDGDTDVVLADPVVPVGSSLLFTFALRGPQAYGSFVAVGADVVQHYFTCVADFGGDGFADVVTSGRVLDDPATGINEDGPLIRHHAYAASGNFEELLDSTVNEEFAGDPVIAPLRPGGLPVIFVPGPEAERWYYKPNLGQNEFGRRVEIPELRGRTSGTITVGDIDADGNSDIAFREYTGATFAVAVAFGDGLGGFAAPVIAANTVDAFGGRVELIDIDNDGDLDFSFPSVSFLVDEHHAAINDGTGQFGPSFALFPGSLSLGYGEFADLDDDGLLDIVIPRPGGGFEFSLGLGGTDFTTPAPILLSSATRGLQAIGDFTGDGIADLILEDAGLVQSPRDLLLARGFGDGSFGQLMPVGVLPALGQVIEALDLDSDGSLDLLVSAPETHELIFLMGDGQGGFAAPETTPTQGVVMPFILPQEFADTDLDGDVDLVLISMTDGAPYTRKLQFFENTLVGDTGSIYCAGAVPNSTGALASVSGTGTPTVSTNLLRLDVTDLPASSTTFFLTSRSQGFNANVPGSVGTFCLGGSVGRFIGPGQVQNSGPMGTISLDLDLTAMPDPSLGFLVAQPGETWSFQAWHRDFVPGLGLTSNFSSALEVLMR